MRGKMTRIMLATMLVGMSLAMPARAQIKANYKQANSLYARTYGKTLPPIGYVEFCARHESDCRSLGASVRAIRLDPARWDLLMQVNGFVNAKIRPVTDMKLYGRPEVWEYPTNAGDCEDYVLLKKRYLEGLGFPAETLLITVVLDEAGAGHAVLMVHTDSGDFVLDNRRDRILPWYKTGYRFLKRQSLKNPTHWVSLTRKGRRAARFFGKN